MAADWCVRPWGEPKSHASRGTRRLGSLCIKTASTCESGSTDPSLPEEPDESLWLLQMNCC